MPRGRRPQYTGVNSKAHNCDSRRPSIIPSILLPTPVLTIFYSLEFNHSIFKESEYGYIFFKKNRAWKSFLYFLFKKKIMATSVAYGKSQVRDWIQATAATTLDALTHCAMIGIKPVPPERPQPWQSNSLPSASWQQFEWKSLNGNKSWEISCWKSIISLKY